MALETDKFVVHDSVNQEQFPGMDSVMQIWKSRAQSLNLSTFVISINYYTVPIPI